MTPLEVAPGLVRWVAPHPDWKPGAEPGSSSDWPQLVGSVLYELADVAVLFDPLLPVVGHAEFLHWLDERVRGRAVTILTTIRWHRRDRDELARRYTTTTTRAWNWIPPGVKPRRVLGAHEIIYWLPGVATIVCGDSLIGTSEGVRVCPEGWLNDIALDRRGLAARLAPLLELPIERVLVSHGEPVLSGGHAALKRAIEEARG
jgi:hypothetical protein